MGLNVKDLIEGKVYYIHYNSLEYILRFKKDKIKLCLFITNKYFVNPSWKFWESSEVKILREATQDEIDWLEACEKANKFVDKPVKKEFIVGKWYKVTSGKSALEKPWYIKYQGYINKCHKSTDYINGDLEFCKSNDGAFGDNDVYTFTLIDLSEIQQYLPKNHIDKIKTGFKKDDYIVITKDEKTHYNGKLNYCYKLLDNAGEISPSNRIPLDIHSGKEARYATKEEIEHYEKIGGKPYDVTTLIKSEYLKPEELIEGCWYIIKTTSHSEFKALFKFKKISNKSILYEGEYYNYNIKEVFNNNPQGLCTIDNVKELKLASSEEVLKYFPNEKFNDKTLKVGDWAIGLSGTSLGSIYYNNGTKAFKILSIDSNSNRFTYQHIDNKGRIHESSDYNFNLIRKALPFEIPKMTFEEALIECKRRYPIGTKFHPVNKEFPNGEKDVTYTVTGSNFHEWVAYGKKTGIVEKDTSGILWYNGVFAEIVEKGNNLSNIHTVKANSVLDDLSQGQSNSQGEYASIRSNESLSVVDQLRTYRDDFNWKQHEVEIKVWNYGKPENKSKKLEIFIDSPTPIKVEPIVELKIKKVSKLTV